MPLLLQQKIQMCLWWCLLWKECPRKARKTRTGQSDQTFRAFRVFRGQIFLYW